MLFKVAIFHAKRHTLLIQSLQQGIFSMFNFLAAVLLVYCGQTLVSCSHPGYARPARPLFCAERYRFQYS